ncbi:MAG: TlpA family protein disulfide reductase, partial [Planctomycetota bacterium]
MLIASTAALALLAATAGPAPQDAERYRAWLDPPGGDLPFFIELSETEAFLVNGPERIPVPYPERTAERFRLEMPYFDSVLEATPSADDPQRLDGTWRKVRGADNTAEVPFHMDARLPWRFEPVNGISRTAEAVAGRWQVDFESGDVPAVGLFEAGEGLDVTGTFLTNTGDYRYLAGEFRQEELLLSCFDGAHAFLFRADLNERGTLIGKFWSGDWWEESWTAERNAEAALPNAFEEVEALYEAPVASLSFPDSKGILRHVMDYTPNGEVLLVQIFGSWCPNCHDETAYLRELDERYRDRGLRIVGLAFELTGDVKRDGAQLDKFRERHGIEYPLLLAGKANKAATALALGLTNHVLSYPTTLFVDRNGQIRSIHSGFSGPAAATEHAQLRSEFEAQVEALLDEPTARQVEQGAEVSLAMDHPLEFSVHGSWESYPYFRAPNRKKAHRTRLYIETLDRGLSGRISDGETTLESHLPVRV